MMLSALALVALTSVTPFPSDTPPARRVPPPAPRQLRAVEDVVLTARMADGAPAPATIVLPQLRNRADVIDFIRRNYPDSTAGDPTVIPVTWVYIDEMGRTHWPELLVSSGSARFDALAVAAARRAEFAPALVDTTRVGVWLMLPVQVRGLAARATPGCRPEAGPCFTPYTVKPELRNRDEVARALVRNYPPELRDRGVSGTTQVWIYLNEEGRVVDARVRQTSGEPKLDEAALRVARIFQFTPARNRDLPVAVWIALPIVFKAR
jgi:TonB family protein